MKLTLPEFDLLRRYIHSLCGITLNEDKSYLIQQRLEPIVAAAGCKSFGEFYQMLKQNPLLNMREQIINAITTNETSFFRDNHPFIAFEKYILPGLGAMILDRKARDSVRKGPKVSVWSAGASTGQEPYSLAMLIHEYASANRPRGISQNDFRLIATDISSETLKKAVAGEYTEMEVQRGLSPDRMATYFKKIGGRWVVESSIRSMVEFRQINLAKPFTMLGGFDAILCRNVLIYFDIDTKKRLVDQFCEILSDGGFFILGSSENLYGITKRFEPVSYKGTLLYTKSSGK
ncbi:MAG: protein-glutamate O-methyltransferase CheR [Pseudomonadota bacterium]